MKSMTALAAIFAFAIAAPATTTSQPITNSPRAAVALIHTHPRGYYKHHHECRTPRCAREADRAWARHRERMRRKREAREARLGWAIPTAIVYCESGGTNKPPNEAGAAGYYQLTEWSSKSAGLPVGHSGYANEHSKVEQGIVARHLYNEQGTGPWVSSESCWGGRV